MLSQPVRAGLELGAALIPAPEKTNWQDESVIAVVDQLLGDAIEKKVSDIHIEPYEQGSRIRYRRDGLLCEAALLPAHLSVRIITRLKIMANLNIAERRLPQDGRLTLLTRLPKTTPLDIRVNTCPTLHGEKMVLRLLDTATIRLTIGALGMNEKQSALFLASLARPQGLILVTGPTGSGKTVTLYSALQQVNQLEKNISTVEDPVEIELHGINQININPKIGLDFAAVLRALLRQDPDILMVGEIRDLETATIVLQAAQTGHLVLSTLHANSAAATLLRLQTMGVATDQLMGAISLIIAQRLLRQLCQHCKQPAPFALEGCTYQGYAPVGCERCYQGYRGRTGIFELLPVTNRKKESGPMLWEAGLEKVQHGMTSYAELIRVMGEADYG